MRRPAGNSNGNTFDFQGRQLSCEHGNRCVVRYEPDGKRTILADKFDGKPLNAPNDIVVHPDGSIWFTDPGYGSMMHYEGNKGPLLLKEAVYRIDPQGGSPRLQMSRPNRTASVSLPRLQAALCRGLGGRQIEETHEEHLGLRHSGRRQAVGRPRVRDDDHGGHRSRKECQSRTDRNRRRNPVRRGRQSVVERGMGGRGV